MSESKATAHGSTKTKKAASHEEVPQEEAFKALAAASCLEWKREKASKVGNVTAALHEDEVPMVEGAILDMIKGLSGAGMNFFQIAQWIKTAIDKYNEYYPQIKDIAKTVKEVIQQIKDMWTNNTPVIPAI